MNHKIGEKPPASGTITEPTEALAPVPAGTSCSYKEKPTEMQAGCRALEFKYAEHTKSEIGEAPTEWGEYSHRLIKTSYCRRPPGRGPRKDGRNTVAEYSYDKLGRLRAEWDARLTTPLKTTYGYDEYGHLTTLNPPGQEPWTFTYGTSASDAGKRPTARKAARSPASHALWNGESVKITERPSLTGSPVVGVQIAVSTGKWTGAPLTYGYQWEECSSEGSCTAIPGANNANYTPVATNVGHTLVATVTATNAGGSEAIQTLQTAAVSSSSFTEVLSRQRQEPQRSVLHSKHDRLRGQ